MKPLIFTRLMLATFIALSATVRASTDIASSPLITSTSVAPNIMFLLDDSGSMQWEFMPDEYQDYVFYLFPAPANVYGGKTYNNTIPDYYDGNLYNYFSRSPHNNWTFYNPLVTYRPWAKGDGTSFPAATVSAAKYNPADPSSATLDLRGTSLVASYWFRSADPPVDNIYKNFVLTCAGCSLDIFPATFFMYKGTGSVRAKESYIKYVIKGSSAFKKDLAIDSDDIPISGFSWPGGISRTPSEEIQNFANWFSYYRSRILATRAGTSIAFDELGKNYRVGFATLNQYGVAAYTRYIPVTSTFEGTNRSEWFNHLFTSVINDAGTPLRKALNWVGNYYAGGISGQDPWGPNPPVSCRQSFVIIASDGGWNETVPATGTGSLGVGNADGTTGPTITGPGGESFTYTPSRPYLDSNTDHLADIAMYYWNRDLRPDLENNVPASATDPAFWQHMSTFSLGIGVHGTLNPETDLPALTSGAKSWPSAGYSSPAKIDDLWHASVNGRGLFAASQRPQEFLDGLRKALASITKRGASMSNVSGNTTTVSVGSVLYQATFQSGSWTGDLVAFKAGIAEGEAVSTIWRASEKLPKPGSRIIKTWFSGAPVSFTGPDVTAALEAGAQGTATLAYLRGDQSNEMINGGTFRNRTSLLGDFVSSSPVYVGPSINRSYGRYSWAGASSYQAFRNSVRGRPPMIYIGSNDGMLHAFDASTGQERFAYIPSELLPHLKDLTDPDYAHRFYVDGEITVDEIYTGAGWKSILISSLGRGGRTLFALDVTDPENITPMWEFRSPVLGHMLAKPQVLLLKNGQWAVTIGNGYNSDSGEAALMMLNAETGSLIKTISTGVGSSNALSSVGAWDEPQDGMFDYVYAGDLHGNLWKFDLASSSPGDWKIPVAGGKIFSAKDSLGNEQPITAPPTIALHPRTGERWIFFGTGQFVSSADKSDNSTQTWYGIRDGGATIPGRAFLAERRIIAEGAGIAGTYRIFSGSGDAVAGTPLLSPLVGWYIDLGLNGVGGTGERMLSPNVLVDNILLGSSLVPAMQACSTGGTGWVMAVDPWLGGRISDSFFDLNNDRIINSADSVTFPIAGRTEPTAAPGGLKIGNGGIPNIQTLGSDKVAITVAPTTGEKPVTTIAKNSRRRGRLSWKEFVEN